MKDGIRVDDGFMRTPDNNTEWMSIEALRAWIEAHRSKFGMPERAREP